MLASNVVLLIVMFTMYCKSPTYTCLNIEPPKLNSTDVFAEHILRIESELIDKSSSSKFTRRESQTNCVQVQCKFVCFNGRSEEIVNDIKMVATNLLLDCSRIEELRIYNYEFPSNKIPRGFLGEYANHVVSLYIASSDVNGVEPGAFADGIYRDLSFENLQFETLEKGFFEGITSSFEALTVVQKQKVLPSVCSDFLKPVKYQIKSLTLQVGIPCVRNMSASDNLLNNLVYVDFSYNNLGANLLADAFSQLSMVEHLDLSRSNITSLPDYIFAGMTDTLEYLDLSYNHLTTLSSSIFGWHEVPRSLNLLASGNNWDCSCELQKELKNLFAYQSTKKMYCASPENFLQWSVFDARICEEDSQQKSTTSMKSDPPNECLECGNTFGSLGSSPFPLYTPTAITAQLSSTTATPTTAIKPVSTPASFLPQDQSTIQLECQTNSNTKYWQVIKRATLDFDMQAEASTVDVTLHSDNLSEQYGLVWFSKVTKYYYKMEINYNEYGLGCYGSVTQDATVENLLPGESYTFCLVLHDQTTVSPFNCKSIYMNGNFQVSYNAWLTQDIRAAGISLVVFGIILLTFVGVLSVFLVLKRKPTLLKGSKRVATTKRNPSEIVVFPKDMTLENFKLKEEMLAKRFSKSTISCTIRRNSTVSTGSNQSYMNTNLYEELPVYLQFDHGTPLQQNASALLKNNDVASLSTTASDAHLVSYAEIPYRTKRTSDDPLPEVPLDQAPLSLSLSEISSLAVDLPQVNVTHAKTTESHV